MKHLPGLFMLPFAFATLAGCAAPSTAQTAVPTSAAIPATPGAYVFGSCAKKPQWPEAARQEKRQGSVTLAFHVDADNTVLDARVKRSSGHADLDDTARVALAKCQFKAATHNGQPVRDWVEVTYVWKL